MSSKAICDTISLELRRDKFEIVKPELFEPNASYVLKNLRDNRPAVQNMSSEDKLWKRYKPQLALKNVFCDNNHKEPVLYVSFSAPKLLYGDNLHEVTDDDFASIVAILLQKLEQMGVITTEYAIRTALVRHIHYCKNIILPEHVPCDFVMQDIEKADISRIFDSGRTDYRNDGHCIRVHTKYHEFAIYDKIKDLKQQKKSPTRSIEDRSHSNYNMLNIEQLGDIQVLRVETRLNSTKTIRQYAEKAGIVIEHFTFEVMFNSFYAQALNYYEWQKIMHAMAPLLCLQDDVLTVLNRIRPKYKQPKVLQFLGMRALLQVISPRHLREIFDGNVTILKLLNETKKYETDSHYKEKIFDSITQAIKQHDVIVLPDLLTVKPSLASSFEQSAQDLYGELETDVPSKESDSWVSVANRTKQHLNNKVNDLT